MVGTSYSFFFKNLIEECRNALTPMLKQKKCSGGGGGGGGKTIETYRCKKGGRKMKKDRF